MAKTRLSKAEVDALSRKSILENAETILKRVDEIEDDGDPDPLKGIIRKNAQNIRDAIGRMKAEQSTERKMPTKRK